MQLFEDVRLLGPGEGHHRPDGQLSIFGYWDGDEVEASAVPALFTVTLSGL